MAFNPIRFRLLAAGSCIVAASALARGQQPQATATTASKADLAFASVRLVDHDGKAVAMADAHDLAVTLDGHPQEVASFQATAASGRVILFVFDDLSAGPTQLKGLTDAAAHIVAALGASDLAGLATTSGLGPSVAPTRDRAALSAALDSKDLIGRADVRPAKPFIGVNEAFELVRAGGNKDIGATAIQRECSPDPNPNVQRSGGSRTVSSGSGRGGTVDTTCATRIVAVARATALAAEQTTGQQVAAYSRLIQSLAGLPGSRAVVALSGGVALPIGPSDATSVISRAAAEADVALYGLVANDETYFETDPNPDRLKARRLEATALTSNFSAVATATGGEAIHAAAGDTDRFGERVLAETASVYRLGLAKPANATRFPGFKVASKSAGTTAYANADAVVPSVALVTAPAADALKQRIEQGGPGFGLPIALTASRRRDTSASRVQLAVSVDVPGSAPAPVTAMFALIDGNGKVVQSGRKDLPQASGDNYRLALPLPVEPGDYRLRVAVADAKGNLGSLDEVLSARLPKTGALTTSDLVAASSNGSEPPHLLALETLPAHAQALHVSLELYPESSDAAKYKVQLAVSSAAGGAPLVAADVPPAMRDGRLTVAGALPVGSFKPDRYVVTATVMDGATPVGSLTTYFRKLQ